MVVTVRLIPQHAPVWLFLLSYMIAPTIRQRACVDNTVERERVLIEKALDVATNILRIMKSSAIISLFVSRDLGNRDPAVDAFRGLAVIGMILVNHAPPRDEMYAPFRHAAWTGWTLADTIFPAFLFLVGVSISLFSKGRSTSRSQIPISRVLRRSALLILLSVALVNFPYYELAKLQLHGTLFRIAVCYFIVALLFYRTEWKFQVDWCAAFFSVNP